MSAFENRLVDQFLADEISAETLIDRIAEGRSPQLAEPGHCCCSCDCDDDSGAVLRITRRAREAQRRIWGLRW